MTPLKAYVIRAVYRWCCDNNLTPHITAFVNEHTRVPKAYVRDRQIILNIADRAVKNLHLGDDWISFSARFGGQSYEVEIPVGHVQNIFAQEEGMGYGFDVEPYGGEAPAARPANPSLGVGKDDFTGLRVIKKEKK